MEPMEVTECRIGQNFSYWSSGKEKIFWFEYTRPEMRPQSYSTAFSWMRLNIQFFFISFKINTKINNQIILCNNKSK